MELTLPKETQVYMEIWIKADLKPHNISWWDLLENTSFLSAHWFFLPRKEVIYTRSWAPIKGTLGVSKLAVDGDYESRCDSMSWNSDRTPLIPKQTNHFSYCWSLDHYNNFVICESLFHSSVLICWVINKPLWI